MERAKLIRGVLIIVAAACTYSTLAHAQGSRRDDIVLDAAGHPVSGATITVCPSTASGVPCTPLATLYTDATLTVQSPNPFTTDGLGNYHFYSAPGRYQVQVSGSGLTPYTINDVILPNDPTTPAFGSITSSGAISAQSLSLGGNLTVSGSATVTGALTAGTFSITNFMPSSLTVTGNITGQGPRPRVDVTAYGAKGDGATDDTAAIQAAINAACQPASTNGGGVVYFPPSTGSGYYYVTQPAGNGPIFNLSSCTSTGITLEGGGSSDGTSQQFARSPMTRILAQNHSSGGLGPMFLVSEGNNDVTFRNLEIYGYNQAVQLNTTTGTVFDNVALAVSNSQGYQFNCLTVDCTTDNAPLAIYSSFWVWGSQMAFQAPTTSYPGWQPNTGYALGALIQASPGYVQKVTTAGTSGGTLPSFNTTVGGTTSDGTVVWTNVGSDVGYGIIIANISGLQSSGLVHIEKATIAGGGVLFDERDVSSGASGNYEFSDVYTEGGGPTPFFTVLNTNGGATNRQVGPFLFTGTQAYDCPNAIPFMVVNAPSVTLTNLSLTNATGCNVSAPVLLLAGGVSGLSVQGGQFGSSIAVDTSGNPIAAQTSNLNGWDTIVDPTDTNRLRTDFTNCCGISTGRDGTPIRLALKGSGKQANVALDPGQSPGQGGMLFGDGVNPGYNANILQQAASGDTLDVAFAQSESPTSVTATPGTGGSCAAGTYYYVVSAYSGSSATQSAGAAEVSATLAASGETGLAWIPAIGPNVSGYVITRSTTSGGEYGGGGTQYAVTGGSTAGFTDTCGAGTSGSPPRYNQTFAAFHRFSQRKLGINNVAPAAQLDITTQDANTVGFNIKAAASPVGNLWQLTDSTSAIRMKVDNTFNFTLGRHLNQFAANGDLAGQISISSSTSASKTFAISYTSAPVCVASPTSSPGSLGWWVTTTSSSVAINLSASGTLTFNYVCTGNPN